jgi:transcriptional regulator with XRE-family HTH domain
MRPRSDDADRELRVRFAKRLHELRHARGLTQVHLARRIGVSPSTLSAWERTRRISIAMVPAICKALECSVADFFAKPGAKVRPGRKL